MSLLTERILHNIELKEEELFLEMVLEFPDIFPDENLIIETLLEAEPTSPIKDLQDHAGLKKKIDASKEIIKKIQFDLKSGKIQSDKVKDAILKVEKEKNKIYTYNQTISSNMKSAASGSTSTSDKIQSHLNKNWKRYAGGAAVVAGLVAAYKIYKYWKAKKAEAKDDNQKAIAQKKMDQAKEKIKVEKAKQKGK